MIFVGDTSEVLLTLTEASAQCVVTSPPYWGLRDYGVDGQLGLEKRPDAYVANMVAVFAKVHRVLRHDGTLWLNLGDTYAGSWGGAGQQGRIGQMANRAIVRSRLTQHQIDGSTGKRPPYARVEGVPDKNLMGMPWRVAFALQADGWILRSEIVWHKPNPVPESVRDRPTKSHEHLFLFAKSPRYFYNADAIREPHQDKAGPPSRFGAKGQVNASKKVDRTGRSRARVVQKVAPVDGYNKLGRNARTVWTIPTQAYKDAHFATFPEALARRCILAGSRPGDLVLDPFAGSGTTLAVAESLGRSGLGVELNAEYAAMAERRIAAKLAGQRLLLAEAP